MKTPCCLVILIAVALFSAGVLAEGLPALTLDLIYSTDDDLPVSVTHAPGDTDRVFIVDKRGLIRIMDRRDRTLCPDPFLDISASVLPTGEQGLLDLAFDPAYDKSGRFFVCYNFLDGTMRVAMYTVSEDPNRADPDSEIILKELPHPVRGHNGGSLSFGRDGYLYFAAGDGSTHLKGDPDNHAQRLDVLYGKLLRLDVNAPPEYIPPSNPYVGDPDARDEIWASGLRQPWRCRFDRTTGDLYIADVGWDDVEELNFEPFGFAGGANYGWRCMEGSQCTGHEGCTCDDPELTLPILEILQLPPDRYCTVIGGYVYRGAKMPALDGRYFFGDLCLRKLESLVVVPTDGGGYEITDRLDHGGELDPDALFQELRSIGVDERGELYFIGRRTIYKLVPGCPADIDGSSTVDFSDLLLLLAAWGPCAGCPADVDDTDAVDFGDLLRVLADWGPCE